MGSLRTLILFAFLSLEREIFLDFHAWTIFSIVFPLWSLDSVWRSQRVIYCKSRDIYGSVRNQSEVVLKALGLSNACSTHFKLWYLQKQKY